MSDQGTALLQEDTQSNWVRMRTLILLRWLAIAGQIGTVVFAVLVLDLQLELGLCILAIGVSVMANILSMVVYPENRRLSDTEAMMTLMFDISQLAFLLFLTGGLNNPFALLILAPVTISATALRLRSTLVLGAIAVLLVSLLLFAHFPLRTVEGFILRQPQIFLYGFWFAIVIGIAFEGAYAWRVASEIQSMNRALLATQMALSREQKLTDLGGVVAATAHELGTPLATIKLVSSELVEELADTPELRDDAALIRDQADRCRDILRSMGRAGKDDLHMRHAPLSAVIREAAEPHAARGKSLHFDIAPHEGADLKQPSVRRAPEIIHGLRNLVQNGVDFARANVWIVARWTDDQIIVRIMDDGKGFPIQLIGRIGDPFLRRRRAPADAAQRPGYEGMGLGLFIAKTLLERSGGQVIFANGSDPYAPLTAGAERRGAIVEVTWTRDQIAQSASDAAEALGENQLIET